MARKQAQKERPREEMSPEERWPDGPRWSRSALADLVGCDVGTIRNYHWRGLLDPYPLHEERNLNRNQWAYTERDLKIAKAEYKRTRQTEYNLRRRA